MESGFELLRPTWLVIATSVMAGLAAYVRAAGRGDDPPALAAPRGALVRAGRVGRAAGLSLALGLGLVALGGPAAQALLAAIAVVVAWLLARSLYARTRSGLRPGAAALCTLARTVGLAGLLCIVAQPACRTSRVELARPDLLVLLDASESMAIGEPIIGDDGGVQNVSRAELANQQFEAVRDRIAALDAFYDVRLRSLGAELAPIQQWRIDPQARVTALAAGLRAAVDAAEAGADPAPAVLLVSDGAETAADASVVLQAAGELADRKIALYGVGVGPSPERTRSIELEPLRVPRQVAARDRVEVDAIATVFGSAGRIATVEWLWDDAAFETRTVDIRAAPQPLHESAAARPPHAGLVRLTVRVGLDDPERTTAETSTVLDVRDEALNVLYLAPRPSSELAFVGRALRGDPRIELTPQILPPDAARAASDAMWDDFDVVLLGPVPLSRESAEALAEAVSRDGVGLMLLGGVEMFNSGRHSRAALRRVSPVDFTLRSTTPRLIEIVPRAAALRHEALPSEVDFDRSAWRRLPATGGGALFGESRPLATVLLEDASGSPVLVVHEAGRGRAAAATWEATWPWALASDEGLRLHRAFWRQIVVWLSNRRPQAWVLTDEPLYSHDALAEGQPVRIRAGVSGADPLGAPRRWRATLTLTGRPAAGDGPPDSPPPATAPAGPADSITESKSAGKDDAAAPPSAAVAAASSAATGTWPVTLTRAGDEWVAELPAAASALDELAPGSYELAFTAIGEPAPGSDAATSEPLELKARSGFAVRRINRERIEPTADLALLRRAAERTADVGGRFVALDELPALLDELARRDRRERVLRSARYEPVRASPWLVWGSIVGALALEWAIRKRNHLA